MKNLKLVIFVLAGTIIVACSKKKDDGQNHYQNPYWNQGYWGNQLHNNIGYQAVPLNTNLNCSNPTTEIITDIGMYCSWLGGDGSDGRPAKAAININGCNPVMVRNQFQRYCMHMARTFGFSVGTGGYFYYSAGARSSGYIPRAKEDPILRDYKTRPSTGVNDRPVSQRPSAGVRPVAPAHPSSNVQSGSQTVVTCSPSENVSDISRIITIGSSKNNETSFSKDCLIDLINDGCREDKPKVGTRITKAIPKIRNRNDLNKVRSSAQKLVVEAEANNLKCKIDGRYKTFSYADLVARCEDNTYQATQANERCVEEVVSTPTAAAETRPLADVAPVSDSVPGMFETVKEKDFLNKCFNLEEIHKKITDRNSNLVSHSRQYLLSPDNKGLTQTQKDDIRKSIYGVPFGSTAFSISGDSYSAIGGSVVQAGDRLIINEESGEIVHCDSNVMEVEFVRGNQVISQRLQLTSDNEMLVKTTTNAEIAGAGMTELTSLGFIFWKPRAEVEAVVPKYRTRDTNARSILNLKAIALSEELASKTDAAMGSSLDLMSNTLNTISNGSGNRK